MWSSIKRLTGTKSSFTIPFLISENQMVTDPTLLGEILAKNYTEVSSDTNYEPAFVLHKSNSEQTIIDCSTSMNTLPYNQPITEHL